ncbi:MAG: asparagine synthase-related protein, partial [Candidatus Marinimicrobia bacterium]|nr:asparagine synthase-related protein [Candidatus Neomarinimicrobiota bacterium]
MFIEYSEQKIKISNIAVKTDDKVNIFVKGYIIHHDELYFEDENLPFISNDYKNGDLVAKVRDYNGCWQIVIVDIPQKKILIINDRWGTYPLFKLQNRKTLLISDNWRKLAPFTDKKLSKQSSYEMASFGYVMGNKTLIENIDDFPAHCICEYTLTEERIVYQENSYWHLKYKFQNTDEKSKEKEFADLWQKQLEIYAKAVKRIGNACYIPMSGGLDSRLLAAEFDKHGVEIYAMTYGAYKEYGEFDSALEVVNNLKHSAGHFIQYLNQGTLERLTSSTQHGNRITTAYFGQMYLDYFEQIKDKCSVIMPGFSGDFMGGSLIRNRMLKWKTDKDATNYILEQRSAPMVRAFYKSEKYKAYIEKAIESDYPKDDDVISNYVRWFLENDIRRYLIRSVIMEKDPHGHLVLPFFDYKLIDFFLELPTELLINKRLYVNTQIKYLYDHNPTLLKIHRAKPKEKIKPIRSQIVHEYASKFKKRIRQFFKKSQDRTQ